MGIFDRKDSDPVATAMQRVADAEEAAARWHAEARAREAELDDLEGRTADELLATDAADSEAALDRLSGDLSRLRASLEAARKAASAADQKVADARRATLEPHGAALQARAAELRQRADDHERQVDALLDELAELDNGVRYVPDKPRDVNLGDTATYPIPKHVAWRRQADSLDSRADNIRQRAGAVDFTDRQAWRKALSFASPEQQPATT